MDKTTINMMGLLSLLAEQAGVRVSEQRIEFMVSKLAPYGVDKINAALESMLETERKFPTIAEIKARMGVAEASDEDKAREVAELIWKTIENTGSLKFDLESKLGPIGAAVVKMAGGWRAICDIATYDNVGTLKAQWREIAEVLLRKQARGSGLEELPQFGPVADVIKQLADKHEM